MQQVLLTCYNLSARQSEVDFMTTEKLRTTGKSKSKKTNKVLDSGKNGETGVLKKIYKLPVIIKPGEIGYFIAEVPILPGCLSQGKTREEALINIRDAAELYLSGAPLPDILNQYFLTEIEVSV
jgi:predicted RNase H-like HicB family nuclease